MIFSSLCHLLLCICCGGGSESDKMQIQAKKVHTSDVSLRRGRPSPPKSWGRRKWNNQSDLRAVPGSRGTLLSWVVGSPISILTQELQLWDIYPKALKVGAQTDICTLMFTASTIHNSQKEAAQVSTEGWMDKQNMVETSNRILLKKEQNSNTFYHMDKPWGPYANWNKLGRKDMYFMILLIWGI